MYDYYFDHWEVIVEETANMTKTYKFTDENEAVEYANAKYKEGERVTVIVIQLVEGWINN